MIKLLVLAPAKRALNLHIPSASHHFSYHLEIVKMMLKWGRLWPYINFKACSGFSIVEFGTACLCWYITSLLLSVDLEKKQVGVCARKVTVRNIYSDLNLHLASILLFNCTLIYLFSNKNTPKYECFGATLIKSPPKNAHIESSNIILQGTYEANL